MTDREVSHALIRRIEAAAFAAAANRFEVEFAGWPECHKRGCKEWHPDPRQAMGLLQHAIVSAIGDELRFEMTTRAPRYEEDSEREAAWFALATLMNRYNVRHAGTFRRAAELIVDAYPALVPALAGADT